MNPSPRPLLATGFGPLAHTAPRADDEGESRDRIRCECRVCGAHTYAFSGTHSSGRCGNCGSYDLAPLR